MPDLLWFALFYATVAAAVYTALIAHDKWGRK